MTAETFKRRALPALKTNQAMASPYEALGDHPEPVDSKTPRVLTRALRSLSSSSLDSINAGSPRRSGSHRRLQKTPSNASSLLERLQRRTSISRDSIASASSLDLTGSPLEQPFSAMEMVHYGHLKADVSLLKARSEYLVLTDQCLVKFGSVESARGVFPQLTQTNGQQKTASPSMLTGKSAISEIRFEIPLRSIVAAFQEEGSSPRFGIEVWWFSQRPRLTYCRVHLFFSLPKERDDWLAAIHRTCRTNLRRTTTNAIIPDNLRIRIDHIVANTEAQFLGGAPSQNLIFPVARRVVASTQKPNVEEVQNTTEGSSFYFVIGSCMCYMVEALRAEYGTSPGDLRVKSNYYGTVSLARFKASVASHEQRFVLSFRTPFGRETRLDLASVHYRRIIEALTKVDRVLKPMWPQHFQQIIFDIKGLPPPLQLTSGNDLGGVERSLQAYCAAYNSDMPQWTVEWHTSSQPAFRLLPLEGQQYTPHQLMAVFRALRYNSFFKAISFRGVDLFPLAGRKDYSQYGEGVVYTSLNGCKISDDHYDDLIHSPVLTQEFHALLFGSESIRSIDLSNCVGVFDKRPSQTRASPDLTSHRRTSSEILSPLLMLAREELLTCHSIAMSGNPLAGGVIDELANILALDNVAFRKLELSDCSLGDAGLTKLWKALPNQASSLQSLDTSDNQGVVRSDILRNTLNKMQALRKLNISGNTRIDMETPIFDGAAIHRWTLSELDLSGIVLNDATVDVLAGYLETSKSESMQVLRLNKCGLTSRQIAVLFRAMGQGRKMTVHLNANRLDEGIEDMCGAIACGYGPWSLFLQMVEFNYEASYMKLWKALTVNKTIECLSLAGSSTPDSVSAKACEAVSEFFCKNDSVRFLDISGYDAKLDEGRLGKEFSRSLGGMRFNARIEHLRVRSQMLNFNVGDLAEAISCNKTLHTLDCEDNGFNLSNFHHLVKSVGSNTTIRYFSAFSVQELNRSVRKSVPSINSGAATPSRRVSVMSRFRSEKPQGGGDRALVQQLKDEWDGAIAELELVLERNRQLYEDSKYNADDDDSGSSINNRDGEGTFSASFGGLAFRDHESRRVKNASAAGTPTHRISASGSTASLQDLHHLPARFSGMVVRSNSSVSSEALSPTSGSGSGSPNQTPSEGSSPRDGMFPTIPEAAIGYSPESHYVYADNSYADAGLQMKAFRRPWADSVSRIEEEDDDIACAA